MKVTPCRSKVYDIDQADVVRIELMTGQIIEVPFENHKSWEVPFSDSAVPPILRVEGNHGALVRLP